MKNLLPILLISALVVTGRAQTPAATAPAGSTVVHFKNGTSVASNGVRRAGGQVAVTVLLGGTGRSETQYPVATVTRIDFPKPAALRTAEDDLIANNPKAALAIILPVIQQQAAFQDIPGNWWAPSAVIGVKALVALGRYAEAEKAIDALAKTADPEELRAARLQVATGWAKQGDPSKAQPVFDESIAQSTNPATVAVAWVGKGEAFLAAKDYDSALMAFLRIPIFYPLEKEVLPAALLGSARAYLHLDEVGKAREVFQQIVTTYPNSPSAAAAKAELKNLGDAEAASNPS